MSKSIKLKNDTYWESGGIIHKNGGVFSHRPLKEYLPYPANGNVFYGATHYMYLGYITAYVDNNHGYASLTLLISSNFYGNQHYSTYIVSFAITTSVNAGGIKIMGNNTTEKLYFKVDSANNKIHIYAYVNGGNSYGAWNTTLLNQFNCVWNNQRAYDLTKEDSWQEIYTPKVG